MYLKFVCLYPYLCYDNIFLGTMYNQRFPRIVSWMKDVVTVLMAPPLQDIEKNKELVYRKTLHYPWDGPCFKVTCLFSLRMTQNYHNSRKQWYLKKIMKFRMIIFDSLVALFGLSLALNTLTRDKYKASGLSLTVWNRVEFSLRWLKWELKMSTKMIILCSKLAPRC